MMSLNQALDELLLDACAIIELSDRDRAIADKRYGLLQKHLERPSSPFREALLGGTGLIYAQGSMAIGATIVSGTDDDRFDVDAIVDINVPVHWSDEGVLDYLEEALQGFPGVVRIVRCTRCVQLQFAFMHMDVTVLDRAREPRQDRVGEIFHSPDDAEAYRVPSNPYGFSGWYRFIVGVANREFLEALRKRRDELSLNRLTYDEVLAKAEQENLPPVIPTRIDSQQVVALKLLKRFVNLHYCKSSFKRPPSIYLTKLSADCGYDPRGLAAQLGRLAFRIKSQMEVAMESGEGPYEENPVYPPDKLNDRWPTDQRDRRELIQAMNQLLAGLESMQHASLSEIRKTLAELFGERVSTKAYDALARRAPTRFEPRTGRMITGVASAASARSAAIPTHRFHCEDG